MSKDLVVSFSQLARGPRTAPLVLALFVVCLSLISCSQKPGYTEDPQSSVVKLKNDLVRFSKGELNEVTGTTAPEESYILMYGYPERPLDSLPISEALLKRVKAIAPPSSYEVYVLARVSGDEIKEYTRWESRGSDDHPLLTPVAFMIHGNPFRITAQEREDYRVVMKLE
jgi:hypothetical protein